jgi:hypothetical protein
MAYKRPKDALKNIEADIYDDNTTPEQILERRLMIEKDLDNDFLHRENVLRFGIDKQYIIYLLSCRSNKGTNYYYNMNYEVIAKQVDKKIVYSKWGYNFIDDYVKRNLYRETKYTMNNESELEEYKKKLYDIKIRLRFNKKLRKTFKKLLLKMKEKLLETKEVEEDGLWDKQARELEELEKRIEEYERESLKNIPIKKIYNKNIE